MCQFADHFKKFITISNLEFATKSLLKFREFFIEALNLIKKVLIALDGSDQAGKALDFALELVEKHSPEIVLLSVIPPTPSAIKSHLPGRDDEYHSALQASHKNALEEALQKVKKLKPNLNISMELVEGRPVDQIITTAESGNYDLIVLGDRGLSGIKEFVLGSVSDRVADKATCSVLIVK